MIYTMSESSNTLTNRLREQLAALEHEQWIKWSQNIAKTENVSPERLNRWGQYWVPYDKLDEATKDHDREWADRILALPTMQYLINTADALRTTSANPLIK